MPVTHISESKELTQYISTGRLCVIDFGASWCGPCQQIAPFFENLSNQHSDIYFFKVDVDEAQEMSDLYNVSALPTFVFIKDNKVVGKVVGANKQTLFDTLQKFI